MLFRSEMAPGEIPEQEAWEAFFQNSFFEINLGWLHEQVDQDLTWAYHYWHNDCEFLLSEGDVVDTVRPRSFFDRPANAYFVDMGPSTSTSGM